jgi:hypothetical protein
MQRILICAGLLLSASLSNAAIVGVEEGPPKPAPLPEGALYQTGPDKDLQRLAVSPDGKTIATASETGSVVLWDAATGKQITTIAAHDKCYCVAFTLDGKSIMSAGADTLVKQWDVASGKLIKEFKGHTGEVKFVSCSPDGKRIASSDKAGTIHVWDIESGSELKAMTGHGDNLQIEAATPTPRTIDMVVWSPDGRLLLTEADDETGRLWDPIHGRQVRILTHHDNSVAAVAISPDNRLAASTRGSILDNPGIATGLDEGEPRQGQIRIWELSAIGTHYPPSGPSNVPEGISVRQTIPFEHDATCITFAPDGRTILAGLKDDTIRQWDIQTGAELRRFTLSSIPAHIAVFHDGSAVAAISPREGVTVFKLNELPVGLAQQACDGLDDAWQKLDSPEYAIRSTAFHFIMEIVPADKITAELLKRVGASGNDPQQEVREAIANLDSDNYSIRLNAFETLQHLGGVARSELRAALKNPSVEVQVRAAELLHEIGGKSSPRNGLVMEILRMTDRPEAREALRKLREESAK